MTCKGGEETARQLAQINEGGFTEALQDSLPVGKQEIVVSSDAPLQTV